MSKWDDMDMTGWVSGLTAIDEDTYRKKVVDEEAAAQGDKPALAAKEDLGLLETVLEEDGMGFQIRGFREQE